MDGYEDFVKYNKLNLLDITKADLYRYVHFYKLHFSLENILNEVKRCHDELIEWSIELDEVFNKHMRALGEENERIRALKIARYGLEDTAILPEFNGLSETEQSNLQALNGQFKIEQKFVCNLSQMSKVSYSSTLNDAFGSYKISLHSQKYFFESAHVFGNAQNKHAPFLTYEKKVWFKKSLFYNWLRKSRFF